MFANSLRKKDSWDLQVLLNSFKKTHFGPRDFFHKDKTPRLPMILLKPKKILGTSRFFPILKKRHLGPPRFFNLYKKKQVSPLQDSFKFLQKPYSGFMRFFETLKKTLVWDSCKIFKGKRQLGTPSSFKFFQKKPLWP